MTQAGSLQGKKGLIVGIANEQSIAWGCARAMRDAGAELAVTWFNDKARVYVEPLARRLDADIAMALDVEQPGAIEAVFEVIAARWERLDFVLHSIAFAPLRPAWTGRRLFARRVRACDGHLLPFIRAHGAGCRALDGRGR